MRITDYTDELFLHLMSKHPDKEIVSQSVFMIDRQGELTKNAIAKGTGPGLDPDLKPIFRLSDGFYQYDSGSLERPACVYRWRGDRFTPLDESESKRVKQKLGGMEQADLPHKLLELDAITEREGWRNLHLHMLHTLFEREGRLHPPGGDRRMLADFSEPFVSNRHQMVINIRGNAELPDRRSLRPSSVVASSLSKTKPWSRALLEADTKGERARGKSPWKR